MLISVIIPAYNEELNLEACVTSVVTGLDSDYEILVIDDGSTDGTVDIAKRLVKQNPEVRLLRHPGNINRGVAASRNLGLFFSIGEYISFIDADDICQPTRFGESLKFLKERRDLDGVLVPVGVIFDGGAESSARAYLPDVLDHNPEIFADDFAAATLDGRSKFHISNLVFRRLILAKSGYFNINKKLGEEDTDFWLRMALCGRFSALNELKPQILYRRHIGNNWMPSQDDYFRDLVVLGEVIKWAKSSRNVTTTNIKKIEDAFVEKLYYCFTLARKQRLFGQGIAAASHACFVSPQILFKRRYWGNLLRLITLIVKAP